MSAANVPTLGIIGVGAIAEAIVIGLSALPEPPRIVLSPRNAQTAAALAQAHPNVAVAADNQAVVDASPVVLLAVRAAITEQVLDDLDVPADRLVISAVAGRQLAELAAHLPNAPRVVRAIPLPAVRSHQGVTVVFPADEDAQALFEPLGGTVVPPAEQTFDALSVSTSTVSSHLEYLALIAGWLADQGMDAEQAGRFIRSVFAGLGRSYVDPEHSLADLRRHHETPGGLNEAVRTRWFTEDNQRAFTDVLDGVVRQISQ